ncbi:MAG: cytochrome C, partial [Caldilineaceae bacterium]|nr:cytochrome C [Caldilineaceae bacterium]
MMAEGMERLVGPRVSEEERRSHRTRYLLPTLFFLAAAVLLVASILQPYWHLTLHAPQYPNG